MWSALALLSHWLPICEFAAMTSLGSWDASSMSDLKAHVGLSGAGQGIQEMETVSMLDVQAGGESCQQ